MDGAAERAVHLLRRIGSETMVGRMVDEGLANDAMLAAAKLEQAQRDEPERVPIAEGQRLIREWARSDQEACRLRESLAKAEEERELALRALGDWMVPGDVEGGERFAVWWGDSAYVVTVTSMNPRRYDIAMRVRGRRSP